MAGEKVRENRLRRMAERQGLALVKSRRRDPNAIGYGRWKLVDVQTSNGGVTGVGPTGEPNLDLEQVEALLVGDVPEYLTVIPKPEEVPAGRVVCHNHVKPSNTLGTRGFRAWLDAPDRFERCDCGWAPELGEHYTSIYPGRPPVVFKGDD